MNEKTRRRLRRRRIAMAASTLALLAGTGSYAGYLAMTKKVAARPSEAGDSKLILVAAGRPADQTTPKIAVASGRLSPFILAKERISDQELLLFGPFDAEDSHSGRLTYQYQAPELVSHFKFNPDNNRVTVTIRMTLAREVKEEEATRLSRNLTVKGATPPTVNVEPLPIRSYVVELIFDESEGVLRLGSSGGGDSIMGPPSNRTFTAVVPDSMPTLRNLLGGRDHWKANVRLRATYDFERVAQGSVSLARVGQAVHRVLEEVRPKYANGQVPPEMYLDRQARDQVLQQIADTIIRNDQNFGLDPVAWASLMAEARTFVERYFADLPRVGAREAITSGQDLALVFTTESGRVNGQAILTKDRVNFREKSEHYSRKANEALKIIRDTLRKGSLNTLSHKELRDKIDASVEGSASVKIFSASQKLKLEKSSDQITREEFATMNDDRDYWFDETKRAEEINHAVYEKVLGEMYHEKAIAKIVDLYRLDERELTSKVEARLTRRLVQGIEGQSLLTETALMTQLPDAVAILEKRIAAEESARREGQKQVEDEFGKLRGEFQSLVEKVEKGALKVEARDIIVATNGGDAPYQVARRDTQILVEERFGSEVKAVIQAPKHLIEHNAIFEYFDLVPAGNQFRIHAMARDDVVRLNIRFKVLVFYVEKP